MLANRFLETYSTESLKVMARRRGLTEAGATKAELISFLAPRLFSRRGNRQLIRSLPQRQRRLLAALKARGSAAMTVSLAAAVEGSAAEVNDDIRALVEIGLLLYPREGGPLKYRIGECETVWMDTSVADAVEEMDGGGSSPKLLAAPPATVRRAARGLLLADLLLFLLYLERHSVSPPSGNGDERRKEWSQLSRTLLVPAADRVPDELSAGGRLYFLYLLLEESGLMKVRGGNLVPAESTGSFFHSGETEQSRRIFENFKRLAAWNDFNRIPELMSRPLPRAEARGHAPSAGRVVRARARILAALRRFDPGRWYAASSVRREIKANHPGFLIRRGQRSVTGRPLYLGLGERSSTGASLPLDLTSDWDRVEGRFISRVLLEPLHWLGIVDLGFDRRPVPGVSTLDAFRITTHGAFLLGMSDALPELDPDTGPSLVVQPDFTALLLSPRPDPALLYDLSRFSRFSGGDRVVRFTLDRESACRGFRDGWSQERIARKLADVAGTDIPQNIRASLEEWERAYGRFRIVRRVTLLEDADGCLPAVDEASRLHGALSRTMAPGLWRVRRTELATLIHGLRRRRIECHRFDYQTRPGHVLQPRPQLGIALSQRGGDWITSSFLQRIAVPVAGEPGTWTLDRSRVRQCVADHCTTDEILSFLEARLAAAQPEWRLAVEAWAGGFEPVAVAQVTVFTCEDQRLMQRLLDTPSVARFLREKVARDTFTLHPGQALEFRKELRRLGVRFSARETLRARPLVITTERSGGGRAAEDSEGDRRRAGVAVPFRLPDRS